MLRLTTDEELAMRAGVLTAYDGPGAISLVDDQPVPEPAAGEVRVRMAAAALNNADLQVTRGGYGRPALPHVLGQEGSGTIDAVGEGVTAWREGDRVCGRIRQACADFGIAGEGELFPVPPALDLVEAASLPVSYLTAAMAVIHKGQLQADEWLLVHPGTGAVGSAAIQLGRLLGAHVIATTGSDAKLEALRGYGAEHAVNYQRDEFAAYLRELSGGHGIDVACDGGGTVTFAHAMDALAANGRIVIYGYVTGATAELPVTRLITRNASVHGMAIWTNKDYAATRATMRDVVLPAAADGRLTSIVDRRLPLAELGIALQLLADRAVAGKLVVTI
jgi:NADPH2:quinone reductase